jgi:hypothetical protein
MRTITVWQTLDGTLHTDLQRARSHADQALGDAITKLSHKLAPMNYTNTADCLLDQIETLRYIVALHDDLTNTTDEES